ncbi:MAG: hypothetical protein KDB27_19140 [Planctomycetales bacterium]|nr:hypothetical protein [Planctomycetales bacterium]
MTQLGKRKTGLVIALLATTFSAILNADTISVNFNNGGATLLDPDVEAGFVPAINWNNFRNNGGLGLINPDPTELIESDGAVSDAVISWEVGASFFNSNNGVGSQRMMEGWFGLNEADDGYILFEDIPAAFTAPSYDAYVYFDSDQVAPNERTMTFKAAGQTIVGKEFASNFNGTFFEATDGGTGNYVVFRDLTDSSFRLTADSDAGRAAITGIQLTTEPEPAPILPPDPNAPIHTYVASDDGNTDARFADSTSNNNWSLQGAELIDVTSVNTSITSAYRLIEPDQGSGGDANPFPAGNMSYELWVKPGEETDGHQVVFETGGGQNGTSVILRDDAVRLLNSTGNERSFDIEVPLADIDTSDFVQIVASLNAVEETITVSVNGSAGGSASASADGIVGRGGNRASLFTWGSGLNANQGNPIDEPGGTFNLGGRTELDDMTPEGLTQFAGQIAILNVYSRALDADEIQAAFDAIASAGLLGDFDNSGVLDVADIDLLSASARTGANDPAFDLNGDSTVDHEDRSEWVIGLKNTWFGDSNLDGEFNSGDFVAVFTAGEFEDAVDGNSTWATGDWNGDGDFTTTDFVIAFSDAGFEVGMRTAAQAVPEPCGCIYIAMLVAIATFRRARK